MFPGGSFNDLEIEFFTCPPSLAVKLRIRAVMSILTKSNLILGTSHYSSVSLSLIISQYLSLSLNISHYLSLSLNME